MTPANKEFNPGRFTILDEPEDSDVQFLDDRINEFNVEKTRITDGRSLAIFLRDHDDNIIAGLHGWTWGRCCEIKTLWIHKKWRRMGLGTCLMAAAEAEARARGAAQITLSTHSFQAPEFYQRLGFEEVGFIEDYPVGHREIFLRKRLG